MCTAISFNEQNHYFGRNLDFEHSFGEEILITPRSFPLHFRHTDLGKSHYAMIGMGVVSEGYPLYFDATNEKGVSAAGLLFSGYAYYHKFNPNQINLAPFEVILWILSQCSSAEEAKEMLQNVNISDTHFSREYPNTPLHWIISDKHSSIILESVEEGVRIYDNPTGVLTNSPPFPIQLFNLNSFMHMSPYPPENNFSRHLELQAYRRGMGMLGAPGDFSSSSRFVRAAFFRANCNDEKNELRLFFDMLKNLSPLCGCVINDEGEKEITLYSSCVDTDRGIYYYTTYEGSGISAVDMNLYDLDADTLSVFSLNKDFSVNTHSMPSATFSYNLLH